MKKHVSFCVLALLAIGIALWGIAGDLNPPPGPISPTMHTLDEIYSNQAQILGGISNLEALIQARGDCSDCAQFTGRARMSLCWWDPNNINNFAWLDEVLGTWANVSLSQVVIAAEWSPLDPNCPAPVVKVEFGLSDPNAWYDDPNDALSVVVSEMQPTVIVPIGKRIDPYWSWVWMSWMGGCNLCGVSADVTLLVRQ